MTPTAQNIRARLTVMTLALTMCLTRLAHRATDEPPEQIESAAQQTPEHIEDLDAPHAPHAQIRGAADNSATRDQTKLAVTMTLRPPCTPRPRAT